MLGIPRYLPQHVVERAPSPRLHVVSTSPPPVPEVALAGDLTLRLRPILPSDKDGLHRGFDRLSPTSRYRRFLSPMLRLPPAMVVRFTEIDYVDHFAWVALDARRQVDPGVAVARYIRCADATGTADVAVTVVDEYQGRGVGSLLMRMLCTTARGNGIERFSSLVLSDNHPMVRLLTGLGARFRPDGYGALSFELDLGPTMREIDRRSQPRYGRESA